MRPICVGAGMTSIVFALVATPARAQQANAALSSNTADAGAQPLSVEEIIVTAQKRSERISDLGMSITVATRTELIEKGITSAAGLTRIEPSLQFSPSPTGTPIYTIRGVGYFEPSLAATPAVSIYQDEVPYLYPVLSKGALLDLDHAEIVKGPQGILFGQNATGGAINFDVAHPTSSFAAGLNATYGRFDTAHIDGFLSGPLSETLSARLALGLDEGGAWQRSETRNDTLGSKDLKIGRLILDWWPNSKFKASVNLNGFSDRSDAQAGQIYGYYFTSPQYISPVSPAQLSTPAGHYPNPAYYATYPQHIRAQLAEPMNPSNDQQADWIAGTHPRLDEIYYQASLRMDYSVSDAFALTSIASYERYKQHDRSDAAGEAVPTVTGTINGNVSSIYQEIRAHGNLIDNRLDWLIGFNYQYDLTGEKSDTFDYFTSGSFLTGGSPYSLLQIAPFTATGTPSHVESETKAVFANLDYKLTPQIIGHAGIRYTLSDQHFGSCAYAGDPLNSVVLGVPAGQCATALPGGGRGEYFTSLNQSNVPWHIGFDWKFAPNNMLYISVSKGYKAGASPNLGAETYEQLTPVRQEALQSYEVGLKSSLLQRTLTFTADYFHYDYTDKQMLGRFLDPILGDLQTLVNVPKSKVDGFEAAATWRPIRGLTLNAAVTYLDSRVDSDFFNYGPYVLNGTDTVNFKGEAFPFTPKWSLNYGVRYEWSLSQALSAFVSLDGSYQTRTSSAFGDTAAHAEGPSLNNKAYGLLNLAVGVESQDDHWRAEIWGKNVTNTYYWNTAFYEFDPVVRYTGLPSTYGVSFSYRY
jgi:iron complex outermembrane recepter protein